VAIPYRSIIPKKTEGLLIASRAFSIDRDVSMAVRMQRDIQKLGEVAGTAAALAVRTDALPRQIDVLQLQERLIARDIFSRETLTANTTIEYQFESGELKGTQVTRANLMHVYAGLMKYFG